MKCSREKMEKLMLEHFYTNSDLAKKIGVSENSISKIRCGKTTPRTKTLEKLCEVFNCKPSDLLE